MGYHVGYSREARRDNEYKRCGTANIFCAVEPKAGRHFTFPTPNRSVVEFAQVVFELAYIEHFPSRSFDGACKLTLTPNELYPDARNLIRDPERRFGQVHACICCAVAAQEKGKRAIILDMDPQGTATAWFKDR